MKICSRCSSDNIYKESYCIPCNRTYLRKLKEENPEQIKAYNAKHYENNKEKILSKNSIWRLNNLVKVNEGVKIWQSRNPEKVKQYKKNWSLKNPEKDIACRKKWLANNQESHKKSVTRWQSINTDALRLINQNRRARIAGNGGKLSKGLAGKLFELQKGKCACGCRQDLGNDYHLDHIMPIFLGGVNEDSNIQLLTAKCNKQKHSKHPIDFMQSRGFLL